MHHLYTSYYTLQCIFIHGWIEIPHSKSSRTNYTVDHLYIGATYLFFFISTSLSKLRSVTVLLSHILSELQMRRWVLVPARETWERTQPRRGLQSVSSLLVHQQKGTVRLCLSSPVKSSQRPLGRDLYPSSSNPSGVQTLIGLGRSPHSARHPWGAWIIYQLKQLTGSEWESTKRNI